MITYKSVWDEQNVNWVQIFLIFEAMHEALIKADKFVGAV